MQKKYRLEGERLLWKQTATDGNGNVVAEREVSVPRGQLEDEVEKFREFVEAAGGDFGATIRVELTEGSKEVHSLVDEIKRAASAYEVKNLGRQLNSSIELIRRLESFYPVIAASGAR